MVVVNLFWAVSHFRNDLVASGRAEGSQFRLRAEWVPLWLQRDPGQNEVRYFDKYWSHPAGRGGVMSLIETGPRATIAG